MRVSSSAMLGKVPRRRVVRAGRAEHPLSGEPPTNTQKLEEDFREEGNVLGYGRSCEHGGNRAFRCSAGGESAAIYANSGRTGCTGGSPGQPGGSAAGSAGASAGQGAGSAGASAGQGAGSAGIHAISGRTAGTAGSPGEPAASWAAS